ncbi:hypothetical protein STVIR_6333 [Streptomyces viridochromogenes Tue57]|uniref:Serine aminopeptidase S33 domain-containing protein n=1 Tax=Streptomyces viridochromogenes Tue57 TaxID=1160705 RepID=L8PBM2_STRVR|nr:hypothetical protein STVIR_6333 [Streptomyces viridochromogenes Tue57]
MTELSSFTCAYDGELLSGVYGGAADGPEPATAVLLHGAGNGSKERLLPLLAEFVSRGRHGLAFDFSGHGESTGALRELSLRRRFEQAVAVIDARVPYGGPLILVGFSMSGQTVADLARHYGERVAAVGLCAPACTRPRRGMCRSARGTDGSARSSAHRTAGVRHPRSMCCGRTRDGRCSRCRARTRSSRRP